MRFMNPTARDLRRGNRRKVLQYIYEHSPISRLELSQRTGLSTGTVTNVVTELLAEGVILESGFEASEGGRRRVQLTMNLDYGYFLGVEVGETSVSIELFDLLLRNIRTFRRFLNEEENNAQEIVQYTAEGVGTLLAEARVPYDKILGMGIGMPGVVEYSERMLVLAPAWEWKPIPLMVMLKEHFQFPLYLDNGSKIMALAEMRMKPDARMENIAALNLGTGVGAGIIYEGKLYRGATNSAGEWGHTVMVIDGELCRCGRRGCLEAYIGATGIMRHLRELSPDSPFMKDNDQVQTLTALLEGAKHTDSVAMQVLHDTTRYLGAGIANLINLFNPQRIVIGGWVGLLLGPAILPELYEVIERYALRQPFKALELIISQLGPDAVCLGAATLAVENFLARVGNTGNHTTTAEVLL